MRTSWIDNLTSRLGSDIGIDLGTATSHVYMRGRGIVLSEPSVVAINAHTRAVYAVGNEAAAMVGRTPAHIIAIRPLVDGVISDFEITEAMLRSFLENTRDNRLPYQIRPRLVIGVPYGVTEVERRAVEEAAISAGARQVFLIEEPMAAAIGANLPIQDAGGVMVVDIGGGTTEVAVISLGGIITSRSLRIAGDELTNDIITFAREQHNLVLGERTAEKIKMTIGSASPLAQPLQTAMRGRDLVSGLPKEVLVGDEAIRTAMKKSIAAILEAIRLTLEETPPELLADLMDRGITLCGGGALLRGLDHLIQTSSRVPVHIAHDPLTCVARGTGAVLEHLDELKGVLLPARGN
jgi:rod shape-determining protein MreB